MIFDSTGSVQSGTGWYLVSLTWYCLVLSGTGLLYGFYASIYKSGDLVGCYHSGTAGRTNKEGKIGLIRQWTMDG